MENQQNTPAEQSADVTFYAIECDGYYYGLATDLDEAWEQVPNWQDEHGTAIEAYESGEYRVFEVCGDYAELVGSGLDADSMHSVADEDMTEISGRYYGDK